MDRSSTHTHMCVCILCIIHIYRERILLSQKKYEILTIATWVNVEDVMLSEISQMDKDKYI